MDAFFELLKSILMGIVQGITEWLPISSTGHMLLLNDLIHMETFSDVFKVVIQLGSILAVVVLYFKKLNPFSRKKTDGEKKSTWSLWGKVLIASIPAAIAGFLLEDWIDRISAGVVGNYVIAAALILYGVLFILLESRRWKPKINSFYEMSHKTALGIGAFQMLALIPGTSRSGSTILGATLLGSSRTVAAEFSFFMAIPVMAGASGWKLIGVIKDGVSFQAIEWASLAVGFLVAFLVSLFVIRFLIAFIKKHDFKVFGYYRIVLGLIVILYTLFK